MSKKKSSSKTKVPTKHINSHGYDVSNFGILDMPVHRDSRTGRLVSNNNATKSRSVKRHLKKMSADSRCDLITKADFSLKGELFLSIKNRCHHILQKYEAEDFSKDN